MKIAERSRWSDRWAQETAQRFLSETRTTHVEPDFVAHSVTFVVGLVKATPRVMLMWCVTFFPCFPLLDRLGSFACLGFVLRAMFELGVLQIEPRSDKVLVVIRRRPEADAVTAYKIS